MPFAVRNILPAALLVECFMLFLFRFTHSPFTGATINEWYTHFGFLAVFMDVASFLIGALLAVLLLRLAGVEITALKFLAAALAVQVLHDVLFYFAVVKPAGDGNEIVSFMKRYGQSAGAGAIAGDSFMYILLAGVLAALPAELSPEMYALSCLAPLYATGYFVSQKPL